VKVLEDASVKYLHHQHTIETLINRNIDTNFEACMHKNYEAR
jgi:hypothetical protein